MAPRSNASYRPPWATNPSLCAANCRIIIKFNCGRQFFLPVHIGRTIRSHVLLSKSFATAEANSRDESRGEEISKKATQESEEWGQTPTELKESIEAWFGKLDAGTQEEYRYKVVLNGTVVDSFNATEALEVLNPRGNEQTP